jgi:kynurenine formamidase
MKPSDPKFPFRIVDLTHPLHNGMPTWPGDPPFRYASLSSIAADGVNLGEIRVCDHAGTHVGAPAHYVEDGATIERYAPEQLVMPLVVLDRVHKAPEGTAWELEPVHVHEDVEAHGPIPPGSLVALRTGRQEAWDDGQAGVYQTDPEGCFLWPGFREDTADLLLTEFRAVALGTDAPDLDAGISQEQTVGKRVAHAGALHVENLANLDHVPLRGAWVVLGVLPVRGASGSPARVIAYVP